MMKNIGQNGLIILLLSALIFLPVYADPPMPTPVGRVVWVKGNLKATMQNNEQRLLQKASIIYLHDILSTDNTSEGQIVFTDNSLMTFHPGTIFYVDKYEFHPNNKKGRSIGTYVMKLIEGGFRTITGLIAKSNPSDYVVNTPVATIGVRGTDYGAFVHAGQLSMAYYSGAPCVNNAKGSICLSATVPFAGVSVGGAPVALQTPPAVFNEKLPVLPAKIAPFTGGISGTSSGPVSQTPAPLPNRSGGPITSFCISQ